MKTKCEEKYGDKQCDKDATTSIASNGLVFNCCKECAKLVKKQLKQNYA